jgi:hypothetical protein
MFAIFSRCRRQLSALDASRGFLSWQTRDLFRTRHESGSNTVSCSTPYLCASTGRSNGDEREQCRSGSAYIVNRRDQLRHGRVAIANPAALLMLARSKASLHRRSRTRGKARPNASDVAWPEVIRNRRDAALYLQKWSLNGAQRRTSRTNGRTVFRLQKHQRCSSIPCMQLFSMIATPSKSLGFALWDKP